MFNRVLFIGLGGAGQRHLRVVNKLMPKAKLMAYRQLNKTPLLNSDFSINKNSSIESEYNIDIYDDLNKSYQRSPDLVIISTPTSLHFDHIIRASNEGASIIVEKPGCVNKNQASKLSEVLKKNNTKFLVSFQRRLHPLIVKLKNILINTDDREIDNIEINVGSYVPSWHPYEDYKSLYACKKILGGGVLLTESHEIDFIIWLFGLPKTLKSSISSNKKYNLDVEDSANILLEYKNFHITINLDFMSKESKRCFQINTKTQSIYLDLESQKLVIDDLNGNTIVEKTNITNDQLFENQLSSFINNNNNLRNIDSLVKNLGIIDQCKEMNGLV